MKFLVNMPLSPALAQWLETQGHDAVHAEAIGMGEASDVAIISRAAADDRIIVTADLDYPRLLALTAAKKPSVILFRSGDWAEEAVRAAMARLLGGTTAQELEASIFVVEHDRVRRRRLPIS